MPWLARLGLHRRELRAWAAYDWANSVVMTSVLQIFQIYFVTVAAASLPRAQASARFYLATTIAVTTVALLAPLLGALADHAGIKKRMLAAFLALGVGATAGLFFVGPGQWMRGAVLFILTNVGVTGTIVFYESLLPHIASPEEVDRVSTAGYAVGYLGGGLLMALNVLWIQRPHWFGIADAAAAARLSCLSAAVWWLAFSIPLFRDVPEPRAAPDGRTGSLAAVALGRLRSTLGGIRRHHDALLLLIAFMIYNDGVVTIIRLAATYGIEVGLKASALMGSVLVVQFVGVPFSFLFGALAGRIGAKRAVLLGLGVYAVIAILGWRMTTAREFFVLALLVGMVQGGVQALSRSMFAAMVPRQRSSEFFGFYGVFEKFAGIFGPLMFTVVVSLTGSSRGAILALVLFFVGGGVLLLRVDVERGHASARAAEAPAAA